MHRAVGWAVLGALAYIVINLVKFARSEQMDTLKACCVASHASALQKIGRGHIVSRTIGFWPSSDSRLVRFSAISSHSRSV